MYRILNEETHAKYAKPAGDKKQAYNNALTYAKKYNKPFIYGYLNNPAAEVKFYALDQPIKCSDNTAEDTKKFKSQYKNAKTVYIAYPDKAFINEGLEKNCISTLESAEILDVFEAEKKLWSNFPEVLDSYKEGCNYIVVVDDSNPTYIADLEEHLDTLCDRLDIGYDSELNENGFYGRTYTFYKYSQEDLEEDLDEEEEIEITDADLELEDETEEKTVVESESTVDEAAKLVMSAYQNANKWFDTAKEVVYTNMNCPFFSSYIHELAHTMPARFDKFGDILHTVNKEIPYPATEELVDKPTTIDEVFTLLFTTLDNIKITLNEFIKATDETAHGMACAAETLLNDIESEYPMLFRLQGAWKNCENDVVDFDKFVCQYIERRFSLLESKKKTIIIKEEQSKMKEFNCWLNDEKIMTVSAASEEEALKEFEKYLQENEMSAEGAWVEDANPSIFEQLFPEADFSSKYVVESAGDISEEFYDEYEDLDWPEVEEETEDAEAVLQAGTVVYDLDGKAYKISKGFIGVPNLAGLMLAAKKDFDNTVAVIPAKDLKTFKEDDQLANDILDELIDRGADNLTIHDLSPKVIEKYGLTDVLGYDLTTADNMSFACIMFEVIGCPVVQCDPSDPDTTQDFVGQGLGLEPLDTVKESLTEDVDLDVEHKYDVATDGLYKLSTEAKSDPKALRKLVTVFNNYIGNNKLVDMSYSISGVGENLKIEEENRYEDEENSFELEEGVDEIFDQATYYLDREAKDDYGNYVEVVNELYDVFKA